MAFLLFLCFLSPEPTDTGSSSIEMRLLYTCFVVSILTPFFSSSSSSLSFDKSRDREWADKRVIFSRGVVAVAHGNQV